MYIVYYYKHEINEARYRAEFNHRIFETWDDAIRYAMCDVCMMSLDELRACEFIEPEVELSRECSPTGIDENSGCEAEYEVQLCIVNMDKAVPSSSNDV
jgi:hypothetical protein